MPSREPPGYAEIGASIAEMVVEGCKSIGWAFEIGKYLGYNRKVVRGWIEYFQKKNAAKLKARQARKNKKDQRIKEMMEQASQIIENIHREPGA